MTLTLDAKGRLTTTKRHKYGVAPKDQRTVDGIVFASKREAEFYQKLLLVQRSGGIKRIERQPRFPFPMGFAYVADFRVTWKDGRQTVYEVKGFETPAWRLKKMCMSHFFPDVKLEVVR